jgi:hypothetical protein
MIVDDAGRIVLAERTSPFGEVELARLLPDGTFDTAFAPELPIFHRTTFESPSTELDYFGSNLKLVNDPGGGFVVLGIKRNFLDLNLWRFDHTDKFDFAFSQHASELSNQLVDWYGMSQSGRVEASIAFDSDGSVYIVDQIAPEFTIFKISRGNLATETEKAVGFRLEATDFDGKSLQSVQAGESFQLGVYVADLREVPHGAFAAYVDLLVLGPRVAIEAVRIGDQFPNGRSSPTRSSISIDEAGGFGSLVSPFSSEQLLFSATIRTTATGTLTLHLNPADNAPIHDVLLHGRSDDPVGIKETAYGLLEVEATPVQWQNQTDRYDVDDDGSRSPDALTVINDINARGARALTVRSQGTFGYLDVNGDGHVSAADVLAIIDFLNGFRTDHDPAQEAEGEFTSWEWDRDFERPEGTALLDAMRVDEVIRSPVVSHPFSRPGFRSGENNRVAIDFNLIPSSQLEELDGLELDLELGALDDGDVWRPTSPLEDWRTVDS